MQRAWPLVADAVSSYLPRLAPAAFAFAFAVCFIHNAARVRWEEEKIFQNLIWHMPTLVTNKLHSRTARIHARDRTPTCRNDCSALSRASISEISSPDSPL